MTNKEWYSHLKTVCCQNRRKPTMISEYLDIMDASLFLDKHPILGSVETFKVTRDMDPIEFGLGLEYRGVVRLTHFTRQCGYNLPVTLIPPPLQAPTSQNYLDGAMLVIQRTL